MAGGGIFPPSPSGESPSWPSSESSPLTMPAEINVAYQGTFGDLTVPDALFGTGDSFSWDKLESSVDSMSTNDFKPINGLNPTISPRDVYNTESVPPSTSFTNLTTPRSGLLDTPDDSYEASPLFDDTLGSFGTGSNDWFPLFGSPTTPAAPAMARTDSAASATQIVVHPGGESYRKRSPTNASPIMKPSAVAGVAARKRDKPLPPITVNQSDPVALKRARNTAAARKSRDKKVREREALEAEIADLKSQVEHWKSMALLNQATE